MLSAHIEVPFRVGRTMLFLLCLVCTVLPLWSQTTTTLPEITVPATGGAVDLPAMVGQQGCDYFFSWPVAGVTSSNTAFIDYFPANTSVVPLMGQWASQCPIPGSTDALCGALGPPVPTGCAAIVVPICQNGTDTKCGGLPITIVSSLPPGKEGVPYVPTPTVFGGVNPTVVVDGLPEGLTANASGHITGTPAIGTAAKSPYQVVISASDSEDDTAGPSSPPIPLTITANCTTPPVPVVSPGISWTQVDPNWSSKPYDHANPPKTMIGDQGCLLTAIAYGMSAAGQPINPITLNAKFDNIPGAYSTPILGKANSGGRISPLTSIIAAASNHALKLDTTYTGQKNVTATLDHYLCSATPQPIIVKVDNDGDTHYVVVTGKMGDTYSIVDPGWINNPRTLLSEYDNTFSVWGVVKPPVGSDPSALSFSIINNATMLVTDPSGAVTGVDAATGSELKGSPQEAYFEISNAINNENETVAANETMYTVESFLPSEGTYTVQVQGLQLGSYELTVQSLDVNGNPQTLTSIPGIANVGSTTSLQVTYSAAGGITKITPTVTFATGLADVSNSLAAGLIGDRIVADILTGALKLAEWGANQNNLGGSDVERFALDVFRQLVNEQSGKQITGLAPEVLQADAASLVSQITAH